jgi:catechol 2,3-dioxygenase-like lactoylglutathione lyase family enzyme
MKIKRIEHIAIAVKSMQEARALFETKLGFKLEYEEHSRLGTWHKVRLMWGGGNRFVT